MEKITDPFLNDDSAVERLVLDYLKHGQFILAYDYDSTVFDWHKRGHTFDLVINLIRKCRPYAKFIVYTHSNLDRHESIKADLDNRQIPWDTINEGIVWANGKEEGKLFYSHFLDDRAGLKSAFLILEKALKIIEQNPKSSEEVSEMLKQLETIS